MDYIKNIEIKSVLYIIFFLIYFTNGLITNNPGFIRELTDPILRHTEDYTVIYTHGQMTYRNITTRQNKYTNYNSNCSYYSPYVIIKDENTNEPLYIYSLNSNYSVSFSPSNPKCEAKTVPELDFPETTTYIDYIQESSFEPELFYQKNNNEEFTGWRCKLLEDELLIYGKKDSSKLSFNFFKKKNHI